MITPRLKMITEHIYTTSAADIGTDHAYVPIYLVDNGIADNAAATDINEGPLKIAAENVKKYGFEDKISLKLGSGLSPIKEGEFETVIIAGMGGEVIKNILETDLQKAHASQYLVLQPMNSQDLLRRWLSEHGFSIVCEDIAIEGYKVYNLIVAENGDGYEYKDEFDLHLPEYLYGHENFGFLRDKKRREFEKIKNGMEKAEKKDLPTIEKYSYFIEKTDLIRRNK